MADDFDRFAFKREANDWEELSTLGAYDDAPPPNPRFVRALRGELMERAEVMASTAMFKGQAISTAGSLSAPLPVPVRARPRLDRQLKFELAAVAILLLSLIGSITLYGDRNADPGNLLNGLATQSTSTDQPFALYRNDAARTGLSEQAGPASLPGAQWRVDLTNPDLVPALAVDGVIYLVDPEGGEVQALSATTGQPFWSANVGRMTGPSIAVANGYVFASTEGRGRQGSDPGYLIALDRATGSEKWRYESGGSSYSAPAVDGGLVYVASNDGTLRVVDADTGVEAWQANIGADTPATPFPALAQGFGSAFSPAIANGNVFVTNNDGVIYAIDLETHETSWHFRTDGNVLSTPAIRDGNLYLAATWVQDDTDGVKGWIYQVDAGTGQVGWTKEAEDYMSIAAVSDDTLYVEIGSKLHAFSRSAGEEIWASDIRITNEPVITSSAAFLSDGQGNVLALDLASPDQQASPLWTVYLGQNAFGMVVLDGVLYAHTTTGTLIALSEQEAATPASGASADLSGLPACQAPDPIDWQGIDGEPANTLVPLFGRTIQGTPRPDPQDYGQQPSIAFADVPTGDPVDPSIQQGILLTLHDIGACDQVGRTDDVSGFFSEDFFRRHWVKAQFEMNADSPSWFLRLIPDNATNYNSIVTLPDGRVSVFVKINEMNGAVIIFVERDGRWVIDELVAIMPIAGGHG
jgi:outer membrane protein assembly factor BamB